MLYLWELGHGHDGKTTSDGLLFSFSVWKHCTIQGSSISEKPHCLKWQPAQSCNAISTLSASQNWCDHPLAWNITQLQLWVHTEIMKLFSFRTSDVNQWKSLEQSAEKRRKLIRLHVIYAWICICRSSGQSFASSFMFRSILHFDPHLIWSHQLWLSSVFGRDPEKGFWDRFQWHRRNICIHILSLRSTDLKVAKTLRGICWSDFTKSHTAVKSMW